MADANPREHTLAAQLDEALIAIEARGLSREEHCAANRELLANAMAGYREEVLEASSANFCDLLELLHLSDEQVRKLTRERDAALGAREWGLSVAWSEQFLLGALGCAALTVALLTLEHEYSVLICACCGVVHGVCVAKLWLSEDA